MGFNNDRRGFGCASSAKTYTVEDYPLILPDIKKLKTLSILGNSSQDGTPSPDNPVEVVGTGERTGNLFDFLRGFNNPDGYGVGTDLGFIWLYLKPNTVYTVYTNLPTDNTTTGAMTCHIWALVGHVSAGAYFATNGVYKDNPITLTSDSKGYITVAVRYRNTVNYILTADDISSGKAICCVVEGEYTAETLPNYEPYGCKVAVTASGRNLFDINSIINDNNITNNGNEIVINAKRAYSNLKPSEFMKMTGLKPGDKFSSKCKTNVTSETDSGACRIIFINNSSGAAIYIFSGYGAYSASIPANFSDNGYSTLVFDGVENGDSTFANLMLLKGSYTAETLPPYEPYKEPQLFNVYTPDVLHGVGDAHDTVILDFDRRKAELVQEVNAIKLTGSEAKLVYTNANVPNLNGYYITNILPGGQNKAKYISTVFNSEIENNNSLWVGYSGNKHIYCIISQFYDNELEDKGLSNFTAFLKQQYDSGNPATIYYDNSKYEPTTTDITALQDWDALPKLKGTWILTAEGGTEPTLKATYTSNTDPYTDYSDIVSVLPVYPDLDIDTDDPTSETNNSIDTIDILDLYE